MLIRTRNDLVDALGEAGSICYGPTIGDPNSPRWATFDGASVHIQLVRQLNVSGELEPIAWDLEGKPFQYRLARLSP